MLRSVGGQPILNRIWKKAVSANKVEGLGVVNEGNAEWLFLLPALFL